MIKKIFNHRILLNVNPSSSVVSAAFVITIAGLSSRFLGLIRDRFLASTFGAGDTLDVYYASFRIPDLIYNLLILGALSAAFIPVFTGLISKNKEKKAWTLASNLLNLAIFFILAISVFMAIFAPWIMQLITPGFEGEKLSRVVLFTRIMFLSPLFLGMSGIFGGILTSFKKFLIYSFAPIFYNLGIIVGVLVFVRFMGPIGLAWGVVFGAFLHMLFQYPAARHSGFRHQWTGLEYFSNKDVKRVLKLMLPRTLGSGSACKRGFIQIGFDDENVFDTLCIAYLQLLRAFFTGHDVVQLLQRCGIGWGSSHGLVGNGNRALTLR